MVLSGDCSDLTFEVGVLGSPKFGENAKKQSLLCMGGFSGKARALGAYRGVLVSICGRSHHWLRATEL